LGRFKLRDENEEDTLMVPASAGGLFASRRQQNTETASSVAAILKSGIDFLDIFPFLKLE